MATLTLNSTNLPDPTTYKESLFYVSAGEEMADGTIRHDKLVAAVKRRFTLQWTALSSAQKSTLITAFDDVSDSTKVFTDVDGTSYSVIRAKDQDELEFEALPTAAGVLWSTGTLVLVEA